MIGSLKCTVQAWPRGANKKAREFNFAYSMECSPVNWLSSLHCGVPGRITLWSQSSQDYDKRQTKLHCA